MNNLLLQGEGARRGALPEEAEDGRRSVLGDGWAVESLFSEALACAELLCVGVFACDGSRRSWDWGLFALMKVLFLHDEEAAPALEDVFSGGHNFSSRDSGELGIEEDHLEAWVLGTEASAGVGEKILLDAASYCVALELVPLDDGTLRFRESFSFFLVLLDVS